MKKLLVFFAILGMTAPAFSQFNAILIDYFPLHHRCDSACHSPITGGYAYIYRDANNNGPGDDLPVPVGSGFGQANFNRIAMSSGEELLGIPGTFATDPPFTITTNTPQPSRYYIGVESESTIWTSGMFTIPDGLSEIVVDGWSCYQMSVPPIQEDTIHFDPRPDVLQDTCVIIYYYVDPIKVCYSPVDADFLPPSASVIPGCNIHVWGCSPCVGPDSYMFDPTAWHYDPTTATLCNAIVAHDIGCVRYIEDSHIPVQFGDFTAESRDRSILLTWITHSEREIQNFVLRRDGVEIYTAAPANTALGSTYTYLDQGLDNGHKYTYSVEVANLDGSVQSWPTTASAAPAAVRAVITEYALHQNYPNPFNPSTNLVFDVVTENNVNLTVYNAMGQEVASLVNGTVGAGRHTVSFDASNLTSGLYFYTVKIGNEFTATKKMLLIK